ncbi:MAG: MCE family protein [Sphingobacteriales bacterium]|nr:MAG: MCE family protein [Sphingobacteriales bacterium]
MKITNEVKVGILAIVAILALVIGFNFLKGKKLFGKSPTIYAVFSNLGALQKSNEVKIAGYGIGTIYDFKPVDKEVSSIIVEIHLKEAYNIPKNSTAFIDGSPLGAAYITISKGQSNEFLAMGDTIQTNQSAGLLGDLKNEVRPTLEKVNMTLDSLRFAIGKVNSIFDPNTNASLQRMIGNLATSSVNLARLTDAQSGMLATTLSNLNSVTANLARNNEAVTHSVRNVETLTGNLANAHIKELVGALESTVNELRGAAEGLKGSINKLQDPKGSIGALMSDRKLYDQLNKVALSMEILLDDVRVHPKRYVNVSVFGGKTKTNALTSPALKDTIPVKQR